jgi:2'-5' RNA ligase
MRAFIGIKLKNCFREIIDIQNNLKIHGYKGNFTLPSNIHMTLVFLGEINSQQINDVKDILTNLKYTRFHIQINKIKKLKDMVILEVKESEQLLKLQKEIENKLIDKNFNVEKRKFYPHVTLIRKFNIEINQEIDLETDVEECILFSSSQLNGVLTYTPLFIKELK